MRRWQFRAIGTCQIQHNKCILGCATIVSAGFAHAIAMCREIHTLFVKVLIISPQGPVGWKPPVALPQLGGPGDVATALAWNIMGVRHLQHTLHVLDLSMA